MTRPPVPEGWEFRLSHDRRYFAFYDPGNGPWFVPEPNMRGRFVDSAEMNRLDWYRYVPEPEQPPADQTTDRDTLRQYIAEALEREDALNCGYDHSFVSRYGVDEETDGFVDAVLAVLPDLVDRAAVLREAAGRYEEILAKADTGGDPRYWTAVRDITLGLRHMAAEAQPTKPDRCPHGCDTSTCPCLACEDDESIAAGARQDGA